MLCLVHWLVFGCWFVGTLNSVVLGDSLRRLVVFVCSGLIV